MRFFDLLRMSASSLWKRKVRTILTVLGVVIGVASIVVMVSLGLGLNKVEMEQMESYGGLTTIQVYEAYNHEEGNDEPLRIDKDLIQSIEAMEHVELVSPVLEVGIMAKYGMYEAYLNLQGVKPAAFEKMGIELGEGSFPVEGDEELKLFFGNQVITDFYNAKTGMNNYWSTGELPDIDLLEDPIFYIFDRDAYFQSQNAQNGENPVKPPKKYMVPACGIAAGGVEDYSNYCWYTLCDVDALESKLKQMFKNKPIPGQPTNKNGKPYKEIFYTQLYVFVDDIENVVAIQQMINDMGYEAYSNAEWIQSEQQTLGYIQAVLGGIGAVSLLVAAIGITNTMMMSIYERTKEIGIMKVLGCNLGDIRTQFLLEAGYIGFIGGVFGLGLSYSISALINKVVESTGMMGAGTGSGLSYIPPWLAVASLGFAIIVGMVAGFFPSLRAMRLSPLAAIRNE